MKLLMVADTELPSLYEYFNPSKAKGTDLILSCGDLHARYLEFLTTVINRPLLYVNGNHDTEYRNHAPEGCVSIEDRIYLYKGLRILGLGGSYKYKDEREPFMYTEKEMRRRIRRLTPRLKAVGGVDILVTHTPARGYGDLDDLPHIGFECFDEFLSEWKPAYFFHGHVHQEYGNFQRRLTHNSGTQIINCYGSYTLELEENAFPVYDSKTERRLKIIQKLDNRKEG